MRTGALPLVLANVQALRAYAAISVATFHFALVPASSLPWHHGSFGVDLFFVLSGFIIAWSTRGGHRHFLLHRVIRVLPTYWVATVLGGVLVLIAMPARPALGWIGRSLLFLDGPDGGPPILFVGWTLVYELVFYVVYAAALRVGQRRAPALAIAALIILAYGGRLLGLAARDWPLLVEFAFGLVIFLWVDRRGGRPAVLPFVAVVAAGIGLLYACEGLILGREGVIADQVRVVVLGLPATVVVLGLVQLEGAGLAVRSRFVLALGAASYALYLVHPLIFSFVIPLPAGTLARRSAIFAVLLVVTVGVALLFRTCIEAPLLRFLRRRLTGDAPSTVQRTAPLAHAKR
jgi:exopolysaccharide production protein ExoZ